MQFSLQACYWIRRIVFIRLRPAIIIASGIFFLIGLFYFPMAWFSAGNESTKSSVTRIVLAPVTSVASLMPAEYQKWQRSQSFFGDKDDPLFTTKTPTWFKWTHSILLVVAFILPWIIIRTAIYLLKRLEMNCLKQCRVAVHKELSLHLTSVTVPTSPIQTPALQHLNTSAISDPTLHKEEPTTQASCSPKTRKMSLPRQRIFNALLPALVMGLPPGGILIGLSRFGYADYVLVKLVASILTFFLVMAVTISIKSCRSFLFIISGIIPAYFSYHYLPAFLLSNLGDILWLFISVLALWASILLLGLEQLSDPQQSIEFYCPKCNGLLRLSDGLPGKTVVCPLCAENITAPP